MPAASGRVLFLDSIAGRGRDLFREACERDLEGIVAKWAQGAPQAPSVHPAGAHHQRKGGGVAVVALGAVSGGFLTFWETKNGKPRRVCPSRSPSKRFCRLYRACIPGSLRTPRPSSPTRLTACGTSYRAVNRAGIPGEDVTMHTLRHTVLSRMIAKGYDDDTAWRSVATHRLGCWRATRTQPRPGRRTRSTPSRSRWTQSGYNGARRTQAPLKKSKNC